MPRGPKDIPLDLTALEALAESHLAAQLVSAVEEARGQPLA